MSEPIILGGAQTDFAVNWTKEGKSFLDVLRAVVEDGLAAAGIDYAEIARLNAENRVAVFVGNFQADQFLRQAHLGSFLTEVDPAFAGMPGGRSEAACASGSIALGTAGAHLRAGDYDVAIVVGLEMMRTKPAAEGNDILGAAAVYEDEAKGVSFVFPVMFGQITDHILARNARTGGIGEARLLAAYDEISRTNYANAKANPNAQTRHKDTSPARMDQMDADTAAVYGGRTRFRDCCQITDGGVLLVLARPAYAREHARRTGRPLDTYAELAGWGHRVAPVRLATKLAESADDAFIVPWTRRAVQDAYRRAGVGFDDVDVFETHDCFTSTEYLALSAFGHAAPGEEYRAVEDGLIARDGAKPVNPGGGLIGGGHPVGATGVRMALDLFKQVTGRAGDYQVDGARTGCMFNVGGSFTTNCSFVIRRVDGA